MQTMPAMPSRCVSDYARLGRRRGLLAIYGRLRAVAAHRLLSADAGNCHMFPATCQWLRTPRTPASTPGTTSSAAAVQPTARCCDGSLGPGPSDAADDRSRRVDGHRNTARVLPQLAPFACCPA